ncbi:MAG: S41 family peptidase [Asgard group archaeon]|nr:S41 family peptidase [Asgard group archaeon]
MNQNIYIYRTFKYTWEIRIRGRKMSKAKEVTDEVIDKKIISKMIDEITKLLNERYIFKDVAKKIDETLQKKFEDGEFNDAKDAQTFAVKVDKVLQEISNDGHLHILYDPYRMEQLIADREMSEKEKDKIKKERIARLKKSNFGFNKLEILEGNIGYLDLRRFCHTDFAAETASYAMNFLANTDSIIIDMRNNGGGEPEMVVLIASYFIKKRTMFNTFDRPFEGYVEQYWTLPYVPGKSLCDKELYILTSKRTYSAGEDFTYGMQCQKRATIIGETTGGGAHPINFFSILDKLILNLPTGRSINPISKTNWEGVGVKPDIPIEADFAFHKAYELALDNVIKKAKDKGQKLILEYAKKKMLSEIQEVNVDLKILEQYQGKYGNNDIKLEDSTLTFYSEHAGKIKLTPISESYFKFEDNSMDSIGVVFSKDDKTGDMEVSYLYISDNEVFTRKRNAK